MLAVRTRPLGFSSLFDFPSAFSVLRALDEAPVDLRRGEVSEDDDSYTVTVAVPGLSREDITLTATDTTLTLSGARKVTLPEGFKPIHRERADYRVRRKLRFSKTVDVERVSAALVDGVLTIALPKSDAARARQITIG